LKDESSDTIILRPSIVGPSAVTPWEGWAGNRPSTFVAAACLYLKNQWSLWSFGARQISVIPVDIASRFILQKSFYNDSREFYARGASNGKGIVSMVTMLHQRSGSLM